MHRFCFLFLVLPIYATAAGVYRNQSGYSLSLIIPTGARPCTTSPPGLDHGVVLVYGSTTCDFGSNPDRSKISFFVSYNVGDGDDGEGPKSPRQLATLECEGQSVERSTERLGDLVLYECVKSSVQGSVTVTLVGQKQGKSDVSCWQNYVVHVYSTKAEVTHYRHKLHEVLLHASTALVPTQCD